ncbi:MAG: hypothetical protein LW724_01145 [Planctomycetaceae bacterium]|jgi:hypothetical protein|nr:hypothetical protein [Planctomycetaceae bacterium]
MSTASTLKLPTPIRDKLSELRSLISRVIATQGIAVLLIWLLGSFIAFGLIDYLPTRFGADESPRIVRLIMLVIIAAGTIGILYHYFWNRWLVRWSDSALALAIERRYPEFQSTLVTTVQAAGPSARLKSKDLDAIEHPNRPGMIELAARKAVDKIASIDVRSLVQLSTLQWELGLLAATLGLFGVGSLLHPDLVSHWSKRLYGLSDAPWPRRTSLGVVGLELDVPPFTNSPTRDRYLVPMENNRLLAPKGSSVRLRTTAKDLLAEPYDKCALHYRDRSGNRGRASMLSYSSSNPREFILDGPPLEAINDNLWFSIVGGDARLSNLVLETVDAPLALSTNLDVSYPSYLQRSTKTTWGNERLEFRNGMRLPQGTQVGFWIRANKPIRKIDVMQVSGASGEDSTKQYTVELDKPALEFAIPSSVLLGNLFVELRLWDDLGLCSTRVQQYVIAATADKVPEIDFVLEGISTAITENAKLPIRSKIKDDYDLDQTWIESRIDEQETVKTELQVSSQGSGDFDIDLKAMKDAGAMTPNVGSVFSLMVAASDFFDVPSSPDAPSVAHVGRSTPIQLSVVTEDQFLILLDRREAAMRRRLEQIISELGQLRDLLILTNKNNTQTPEPSAEDSSGSAESKETPAQARSRILLLRSQQAAAQVAKSEGELNGVLSEISMLVAELTNNRIDSNDRRERLGNKIKAPLESLLESKWRPFALQINQLEGTLAKLTPEELSSQIDQGVAKNNEIIASLNAILADMIEIQDLNEIIDRVRGLLDQQSKILDRSKQEQKKSTLDLLK